jgi:hypothetical protein
VRVSHRPLAIVSGLTIGDYLLWNWSLNGNHDVLALVSGLTLPPLAIALLWLLALTGARLLAGDRRAVKSAHATADARRARFGSARLARRRASLRARRRAAAQSVSRSGSTSSPSPSPSRPSRKSPSRKIAA